MFHSAICTRISILFYFVYIVNLVLVACIKFTKYGARTSMCIATFDSDTETYTAGMQLNRLSYLCFSCFGRLILLELLHLLARHKPRRLHAFFQILKGIGARSSGQVVKSPANTFLFQVRMQLMEFLTRKRLKNRMQSDKRQRIPLHVEETNSFFRYMVEPSLLKAPYSPMRWECHLLTVFFREGVRLWGVASRGKRESDSFYHVKVLYGAPVKALWKISLVKQSSLEENQQFWI